MATYLILNIIFILGVIVLLRPKLHRPSKAWWITFASLMVMTLIFDNVIVGLGIVAYNATKILGIFAGYAPIEDFFYAILAAVIVPLLWNGLTFKKGTKHVK